MRFWSVIFSLMFFLSVESAEACIPPPAYVDVNDIQHEATVRVKERKPLIIRSTGVLEWEENLNVEISLQPPQGFGGLHLYQVIVKEVPLSTDLVGHWKYVDDMRSALIHLTVEETPPEEMTRGMQKGFQVQSHGCGGEAHIEYH